MKNTTIAVVLAVILVGGFFVFNNYIYSEKQADVEVGQTVTESGKILAIDTAPLAYDGSAMVTIQTAGGVPKSVAIPARGFNLCPGFKNVTDVHTLAVGQEIEVKGNLDGEGTIVPCESESHYLRISN